MKLHRPKTRADWVDIAPGDQNWWQHVAAQTHGIVTPGNVISFLGLSVSLGGLGLFIHGIVMLGLAFILAGRLVDILDGLVADLTHTKSPLGAMVDASFDKLIAFLTLIVFAMHGVLPFWVALAIGVQNIANVVLALIARQRYKRLYPSRLGKNAAAGFWFAIMLFMALYLLAGTSDHFLLKTILTESAYALFAGAMAIGIKASMGYFHVVFGKRSERYAALALFDRYIVIHNPVSADAYKTAERLRELRRLRSKGKVFILDTLPGGNKANGHLLRQHADKLGERTLLCVAGGDGTVSMVIDALLHEPGFTAEQRRTPIAPLWCGNANDLAYILSGRPTSRPVHKLLKKGSIIAVRPMECRLVYANGRHATFTAACYASFGATAFATREMQSTLRSKSPIRRFGLSRFGQEFFAAMWALMRAPTFKVTENGQTRVIFERTHLNGSRFAKVIGLPLSLTDSKFHRATIEHKHLVAIFMHIIGLVSDRNLSKKTITRDVFTVHDPIWAQFDGEAVHIPADTEIRISIAQKPFYALSTRLSQ